MHTLLQDMRYGLRMLVKTPIVTIVAAFSLALGIAGATAMFALASSFFFEPLPFGDQDGLVMVSELRRGEPLENADGVSAANLRDLQAAATTTATIAAYTIEDVNLTGLEQPEQIRVVTGTPNIFEALQVPIPRGRSFRAEEGVPGNRGVLVLTHPYWRQRFEEDPGVLGRIVHIDGAAHTIIGVTGPDFEMVPADVQAFRPSDFTEQTNRARRMLFAFGRLRPGATVAQAATDLSATYTRLETEYPDANRNRVLTVRQAREWFPGPTDTRLVLVLVVVALFGFAIACTNVANLLLGRAEARIREMAVRTALGAGRGRVLRQLLTESVLLALTGGAIGTLFSVYVIRGLRTAMPAEMPRAFWPVLDVPTLAVTVLVVMVAGVLFGLAPALHATGGGLRESLGEGARGGTAGRRRKRLRSAFVITEVAVALALLTGAAYLIKAMDVLVRTDPGFDPAGLITFELNLPEHRYPEAADLARFAADAERTLAAIPGVQGVAIMSSLPRSRGNPASAFHIEGAPEVDPAERPVTGWQSVSPEYFSTIGVSLRSGRLLEAADRADTQPVAVVNRAFAARYLPDGDVPGSRIEIMGTSREIVGVVSDIVQSRIPSGGMVEPALYLPASQQPRRNPRFALRTAGDLATIAPAIRQAIATVDPEQPIALLRSLDEHTDESLAGPRVIGMFVLALGILAMILASIGIYGVMAQDVSQATREIGIRMAVGAKSSQVVAMVTRRGLAMTGIGLLAGVPLALLIYRGVVAAIGLFEVSLAPDYALAAAGLLVGVAALACWLPARRAAHVEPVRALHGE